MKRASEALEAGDHEVALAKVREAALTSPLDAGVLGVASAALAAVGEEALSATFRAAARGDAPELVALTEALLGLGDTSFARAAAKATLRRLGGRDRGGEAARMARVATTALARAGEHDEVVEAAAGWSAAALSKDPVLVCRVALSAAMAGHHARAESLAQAVASAGAPWIAAAGQRARAVDADGDAAPLRHAMFVEYGAVLLDAERVFGEEPLPAARLARVMARAARVLRRADAAPDRVAYASKRGEVLARWLADALGCTPIPFASRLRGQDVLLVAADGLDAAAGVAHRAASEGPFRLFVVALDARDPGAPVGALIGLLDEGASLPLSEVVADKAADRLPPSMVLSRLRDEAGAMPARSGSDGQAGDLGWPYLDAWVEARRDHLALLTPAAADEQLAFVADVPRFARVPPPREDDAVDADTEAGSTPPEEGTEAAAATPVEATAVVTSLETVATPD